MEEDRDGLWRQAVQWLTAFGVLPTDHRCCSPDSKLIDLLYTLRDGVLLCHLLHKIDPASLDFRDVSLKPQMAQVGVAGGHREASMATSCEDVSVTFPLRLVAFATSLFITSGGVPSYEFLKCDALSQFAYLAVISFAFASTTQSFCLKGLEAESAACLMDIYLYAF